MERNHLKDAHIAVMLGVNAQTVQFWRKGVQQPRFLFAQQLRKELPGFADLLDGRAQYVA